MDVVFLVTGFGLAHFRSECEMTETISMSRFHYCDDTTDPE
jgi:hypothetical protein